MHLRSVGQVNCILFSLWHFEALPVPELLAQGHSQGTPNGGGGSNKIMGWGVPRRGSGSRVYVHVHVYAKEVNQGLPGNGKPPGYMPARPTRVPEVGAFKLTISHLPLLVGLCGSA